MLSVRLTMRPLLVRLGQPSVIDSWLLDSHWPDAGDQIALRHVSVTYRELVPVVVAALRVLCQELRHLSFHRLRQHPLRPLACYLLQNREPFAKFPRQRELEAGQADRG